MRAERVIRSFWVKAAAFLLAALLAPVMAIYGEALVMSSTGAFSGTFFESSFCLSTAARSSSIVRYFRWSTNGKADAWEEFLSSLDQLYPAEDSTTNIRFALQEGGTVLYDNHRTGDVFLGREVIYSDGEAKTELTLYADPTLSAQDALARAARLYGTLERMSHNAMVILLLCVLAALFLVIFLARRAARQPGADGPVRGWQEHIPLDLYVAADTVLIILLVLFLTEGVLPDLLWSEFQDLAVMAVLGSIFAGAVLLLGLWVTFCARIKLGKWWRGTVIFMLLHLLWRIIKALGRGIRNVVRALPLVWRTALGGAVLTAVLTCLAADDYNHSFGAFCIMALLTLAACWIALQLRRLQKAGQALAAGDLAAQVDTRGMLWDLKGHGEDLNAVSRGMAIAVDEQLRSERLKTELITNISHDIKTPLTSIVNYVDLLQREHTPEQEAEYLAVLDRQAKKLKKLTMDLVEMSKASSGTLPCHPAPRRAGELVEQAVGEYADRLAAAGLEPVITMPEQELICLADGALIWRVLDNLLGNACKYAQSGTRLYIDGWAEGDRVVLSFKNISREALNISADELMERFVRGDASRSTEGSGLGLNIARSLMELQGGDLRLDIDGDLFKAYVTLPRAED